MQSTGNLKTRKKDIDVEIANKTKQRVKSPTKHQSRGMKGPQKKKMKTSKQELPKEVTSNGRNSNFEKHLLNSINIYRRGKNLKELKSSSEFDKMLISTIDKSLLKEKFLMNEFKEDMKNIRKLNEISTNIIYADELRNKQVTEAKFSEFCMSKWRNNSKFDTNLKQPKVTRCSLVVSSNSKGEYCTIVLMFD